MLVLLLERPGEVITREAVRQRLWPADTFVDFDAGLNSSIKKLRDALGDAAESSQFVETLPRRGYRFIAPVHPVTAAEVPASQPPAAPAVSRVRPRWIVGAVLVGVVTSALAVVYQSGSWQRLYAGPPTEGIRALAVLPFENLTGDPAQDYLAGGITDALTSSLAQAGGFHVVSRTSAAQYRSANKSLPAIARELNVDAVLEGSVVRWGRDVRVTAQLIDAGTDRHLWARSYEVGSSEVVRLHQQIARAIAAELQSRVTSSAPARADSTLRVNPEAYDAYLKGAFAMGRQTYDGIRSAVASFEDAIAREPAFAEAHAALAQAQIQLLFVGPLSPREVVPKAEAAARRALELDDTIAEAHRTLATIFNAFYWRWEDAEREARRARELAATDPGSARAEATPLIREGRFEEAIAEAETASTRNPRSFNAHLNAALAYRAAGQHERAIARFRRALEIDPAGTRAQFQLGATLVMMGRLDDGIRELEAVVTQSQRTARFLQPYLGYAYAASGRRGEALRILQELESRARHQYVSSFGIALIHDGLGQKEPALAALEQAYQDRAVEFVQMAQYPAFKTIASDPRYDALMRRIGLPDKIRARSTQAARGSVKPPQPSGNLVPTGEP